MNANQLRMRAPDLFSRREGGREASSFFLSEKVGALALPASGERAFFSVIIIAPSLLEAKEGPE